MRHTSLIDNNSNGAQRYLTHSVFRYFGKYPPTSTRMLLEKLWERGAVGPVVDIMCGSGTTLLEALLAGRSAIGVDVNPISVLISQVKVEKADPDRTASLLRAIQQLAKDCTGGSFDLQKNLFSGRNGVKLKADKDEIKRTANTVMECVGRWFSEEAALQHAVLRVAIQSLPASAEKRLLLLAWMRTVRKSSNASSRTGRLFLDKQKTPKLPFQLFPVECETIQSAQEQLPAPFESTCQLFCASAMRLSEVVSDAKTMFWHPPYFALYKYSSDVLRLELEWMGIDRKTLASSEIRDGFKTSNPNDAEKYLADCAVVWKEMFAACASGARGVAINSDSTLAKKTLNIFNRFAESASAAGFEIENIYRRQTTGTAAKYHKSADAEIQTKFDYIVCFRKP